jgi:hypothetical protein
MAVIYTPHFAYFTDDDGAPLNGGLLYTYEAGTTTPKATYTDSTGGTPNANPVVLDSAGRATVFISGSYKFTLKDSSGNTIKTTDNVTAFSLSESGVDDIITNFTEDTIATGDSIIFSDVSDSGNTKRDTVQGILDLVPASSSALTLLGTASASASATIDFINGQSGIVFDSTYSHYILDIIDLVPATDATNLYLRTTTNASTFDSGASDYYTGGPGIEVDASLAVTADGLNGGTAMIINGYPNGTCGSAAGENFNARIDIWKPSGTNYTVFGFHSSFVTANGNIYSQSGAAMRKSAADIDGVRVLMSSGNITSGLFKLYGVKAS